MNYSQNSAGLHKKLLALCLQPPVKTDASLDFPRVLKGDKNSVLSGRGPNLAEGATKPLTFETLNDSLSTLMLLILI